MAAIRIDIDASLSDKPVVVKNVIEHGFFLDVGYLCGRCDAFGGAAHPKRAAGNGLFRFLFFELIASSFRIVGVIVWQKIILVRWFDTNIFVHF